MKDTDQWKDYKSEIQKGSFFLTLDELPLFMILLGTPVPQVKVPRF